MGEEAQKCSLTDTKIKLYNTCGQQYNLVVIVKRGCCLVRDRFSLSGLLKNTVHGNVPLPATIFEKLRGLDTVAKKLF